MALFASQKPAKAPWKVLLVDDEPDIHDVTKLTLHRFRLDERSLQFFDAYSADEAKQMLAAKPILRWFSRCG